MTEAIEGTIEDTAPKNGRRILTIEDIRDAKDVTIETVPVDEWGGDVQVASLTYRQMKQIRKDCLISGTDDEVDNDALEKAIFMQGMVDPKIDEEGYQVLLDKSADVVQRILLAISDSSGMGEAKGKAEENRFPEGA